MYSYISHTHFSFSFAAMILLAVISALLLFEICETIPVWNEARGQWQYEEGDKPNKANEIGSQTGKTFMSINFPDTPNSFVGFFEADIVQSSNRVRNGILSAKKWPDNCIPFEIAQNSSFSAAERKNITVAMSIIQSKTCIKFKRKTNEIDYVSIQNTPDGCYSYVGRNKNAQVLSLQRGTYCTKVRNIIHELLHAVGLYHEHSRYDRDPYLKINLDNVVPAFHDQFRIVTSSQSYTYGAPFDYDSIMLYSKTAGAVNKSINVLITTDKSKQNTIGYAEFPSVWDYYKIKKIYNCT